MKNIISMLFYSLIILAPLNSLTSQINNSRNIEYNWKTDLTKKAVDLSEIQAVLPRNSFPTIDYPDFIDRIEGLKSFFRHEPVISVAVNGEAKAYPLNILTMHEISNDSIGGIPILPSYCPLCNSSMVFDRRINYNEKEYTLDFEVSGMLRNSDMIIADKQTESWWQQIIGYGLAGEMAGAELTIIPSMVISVEEFFKRYPKGKILSPKTGTESQKRYGTNPYENYDNEGNKPWKQFFDHEKLDSRLAPMERVIGIKGKNGYKIYPFSKISKEGIINDNYDNKNIVIFFKEETVSILDNKEIAKSRAVGSATVFSADLVGKTLSFKKGKGKFIDINTKSIWDITGRCIEGYYKGVTLNPELHSNNFAFAWLNFHPESIIY